MSNIEPHKLKTRYWKLRITERTDKHPAEVVSASTLREVQLRGRLIDVNQGQP